MTRLPLSPIVHLLSLGLLSSGAVLGCGGEDDADEGPVTAGQSGGAAGAAGGPQATEGSGGSPGGAPAPTLPAPTGACPEFREGTASISVGGVTRSVNLYVDEAAAAASDGPIVFYWYGTGGRPEQALQGLGADGIARIKAAGGVVVAPTHANGGIFPWIQGDVELDFALTDEVVACADEKIGIDARHIHALGFSAGALFTAQLSLGRSAYMASVVTYSGGGGGMPQDPNNHFAALIFHGGPTDVVVLEFQTQSQIYYDQLTQAGHFTILCNHGQGHRIPTDAVPSAVQFFFDHPYGASPSPYASALPPGFPAYCSL